MSLLNSQEPRSDYPEPADSPGSQQGGYPPSTDEPGVAPLEVEQTTCGDK